MRWIERFKAKYGITTYQFVIIMIVFACTGSTIVIIKKPLIAYLFEGGIQPTWFRIAYWILILPIYNLFLLFYGFVFGQFAFFWNYEKRMLARFSRKKDAATK
jgi:hypothetical protein